jgi:hypothetical protein
MLEQPWLPQLLVAACCQFVGGAMFAWRDEPKWRWMGGFVYVASFVAQIFFASLWIFGDAAFWRHL